MKLYADEYIAEILLRTDIYYPYMFCFSRANDSIFIYLSDHGGHGVFQFPNSTVSTVSFSNVCLRNITAV